MGITPAQSSRFKCQTYFDYDGTNLLAEMDADGALTVVYTNGANGLVSKRAGSTSTFYTYDPQGSVSARMNDQGALVSTDLYDAYGSLRDGNSNSDPVGYCGQWGYYTDLRLLAAWVDKIELAPETLEVEIRFKVPEPVVDRVGAGVGFEPTTFGL